MCRDHKCAGTAPVLQNTCCRGGLSLCFRTVAEEGVEGGLVLLPPGESQLGRLASAAPLRGQDLSNSNSLRFKSFPDAPRLGSAGLIKIALGCAVPDPHSVGITPARCVGMPEKHDAPLPQCRPRCLFRGLSRHGGQCGQGQAGDDSQ